MGVFFESRSIRPPVRRAVEDALLRQPEDIADPQLEAQQTADQVAQQVAGIGQPKAGAFAAAAALLIVFAGGALVAELNSLDTASEQLWTAFQTILGVIVGFLGGEATGAATRGETV